MKNPQNLPAVRENVKKCQKESDPAGCELLSNFISLTDWKQRKDNTAQIIFSCELLSNFISLTDWKQPQLCNCVPEVSCELLSNFISLTDWKQPCCL